MNRLLNTRLLPLAGGGLLAAAAAFASPAHAVDGSSVVTVWARINGVSGQPAGRYVSCPPGDRVTAAQAQEESDAPLTSLTPTYDGAGAYGSGQLASGGVPYLYVGALCAPASQLAAAQLHSLTLHYYRNPVMTGTLQCPAGQYAIDGGGFFTDANGVTPAGNRMFADTPTVNGSGWTYGAWSASLDEYLHISVWCLPAPLIHPIQPQTVLAIGYYPIDAPDGFRAAGVTNCPAGYTPLTGGVEMFNPNGTPGNSTSIFASFATHTPDGWYASSEGWYIGQTMRVIVRCVLPGPIGSQP